MAKRQTAEAIELAGFALRHREVSPEETQGRVSGTMQPASVVEFGILYLEACCTMGGSCPHSGSAEWRSMRQELGSAARKISWPSLGMFSASGREASTSPCSCQVRFVQTTCWPDGWTLRDIDSHEALVLQRAAQPLVDPGRPGLWVRLTPLANVCHRTLLVRLIVLTRTFNTSWFAERMRRTKLVRRTWPASSARRTVRRAPIISNKRQTLN